NGVREDFRSYLREGEQEGARYRLNPAHRPPSAAEGQRLGARAGSSLEFHEHREYQPGDDLRSIDWGAFARSDRLVVKRYQEETSPHLALLLDVSRSRDLAGTEKAHAALGLAALLHSAARNARFSCAVWLCARDLRPLPIGSLPPSLWEGIDLTS